MTDKKFTDEEIIQALECHINAEDCVSCEMFGWCDEIILTKLVLDLINRQKAEIEKLKKENEILSRNADNAFQEGLNECRELFEPEIKSEALKEFAERIKMSIKANVVETLCNDVKGVYNAEYVIDDIDNLLKEMVGEEK
jgi:hypothetical protein